jgi:cellulose synthase/poly-beta-1,6-N-acetylglucosamine synthase-like glycosyltransferase
MQPPSVETLILQPGFFASIALIAYVYVGYPLMAFLLSNLFTRPVRRSEIAPRVSVIIAARNEEQAIGAKIENTLALDYPEDKIEVVVASDCSTDRTNEIVAGYAQRGVILFKQTERHGKTVAQFRAVSASSGEILVFSDATTMYRPDALRKIIRNFADPEVGCVADDPCWPGLPLILGLRKTPQVLREPSGLADRSERLHVRRAAKLPYATGAGHD